MNNKKTTCLNYKNAVQELFVKKKNKENKLSVYNMPKGWIHLKKDGTILDNRTKEEIEEFEKKQRDKILYYGLERLSNRFLNYKRIDLLREGYTEEEIEDIIYNILDDDEVYDYNDNNEDYSSDEYYSDDDMNY